MCRVVSSKGKIPKGEARPIPWAFLATAKVEFDPHFIDKWDFPLGDGQGLRVDGEQFCKKMDSAISGRTSLDQRSHQ